MLLVNLLLFHRKFYLLCEWLRRYCPCVWLIRALLAGRAKRRALHHSDVIFGIAVLIWFRLLFQKCFLENRKTWRLLAATGFYRIFSDSNLHACTSLTTVYIIGTSIKWLRPIVNHAGSHLLLLHLLSEEASYVLFLLHIRCLNLILLFPLNRSYMVVIRVLPSHLLSLLKWVHLQLILMRMRDVCASSFNTREMLFECTRLATIFGGFIAPT